VDGVDFGGGVLSPLNPKVVILRKCKNFVERMRNRPKAYQIKATSLRINFVPLARSR